MMLKLSSFALAKAAMALFGVHDPNILNGGGPPVRVGGRRGGARPTGYARAQSWFTAPHTPHGEREKARRVRQNAHQRQLDSHKPGTVQPFHVFHSFKEEP